MSLDVTSIYTWSHCMKVTKTTQLLTKTGIINGICNQNIIEKLLLLACKNICILAHNGYHKQRDGLAMGSPLGPFLA